MPGAGFLTMAVEAMYQKYVACLPHEKRDVKISRNDLCYRFRNVKFMRALFLEEDREISILSTLTAVSNSTDWHRFSISTSQGEASTEYCHGFISIRDAINELALGPSDQPLKSPQPGRLWYKWLRESGLDFGPAFQKFIEIEAITGERNAGVLLSLEPSPSKYEPQAYYPIHPAALDGCL
jgi:hypothetical protein